MLELHKIVMVSHLVLCPIFFFFLLFDCSWQGGVLKPM